MGFDFVLFVGAEKWYMMFLLFWWQKWCRVFYDRVGLSCAAKPAIISDNGTNFVGANNAYWGRYEYMFLDQINLNF